jgi:hypothetical protein
VGTPLGDVAAAVGKGLFAGPLRSVLATHEALAARIGAGRMASGVMSRTSSGRRVGTLEGWAKPSF